MELNPNLVLGLDLSVYQSGLDWNKVVEQNIKFVYIKASEGIYYRDSEAANFAKNAKANGIKVGYYHFASLKNPDAKQGAIDEAEYFVDTLRGLSGEIAYDLPVVLDLEVNPNNFDKDNMEIFIQAFMERMISYGHTTLMIYSYTPFLNTNLKDDSDAKKYPLWLAQYSAADEPILPNGFEDCLIWQYSNNDHIGSVTCDINMADPSLIT